ncbi:putative alcohol oxidase [Hypoxylon sp. CI-4A]|nr:putative alcohol oxidase [Hypoxylon sp. CI-4A]
MGIFATLPGDIEEVDVVIAGGGTVGCVVASRLADADPNLSILVIESGKDNHNDPTVNHPLLWMYNFPSGNLREISQKAVKEEQLANRELAMHVGNILGGGSSVNGMMYARAHRCDYDSWNTKGWSTDDLMPYLNKYETYHGSRGKDYHGYDGPVHVSHGPLCNTKFVDDAIDALKAVGVNQVEDLQDYNSIGVARGNKFMSPGGKRQDVGHSYLHPRLQDGRHPNLHVLVESQVLKVIFKDGRACGVEYRPNPSTQPNSIKGTTRIVKARQLVVLSCGTLGSPPILKRSGIGGADILKQAGVLETPVVDLPGVGHDYQDHIIAVCPYKSDFAPGETTDAFHNGEVDTLALLAGKNKILGWNGVDVSAKLRPTTAEVDALGPAFRESWDKDFKDPTKPLAICVCTTSFFDRSGVPPGQYFSLPFISLYPYSRGHAHITGPDIDDPLDFKTGYLSDKHDLDLKVQVWAYKKQREIARRMLSYRGELSLKHPVFPAGSKASYAVDATAIGESHLAWRKKEDIEYSAEDDAVIEQWIRENLSTCWHGLGTCKMAPREKLGVVDESLGVYGVSGLKIADLSIAPENVGANTMSTALAIGEKAADIFIHELGLDKQ